MHGRFISFEGGEGSGKSTQARLLADVLRGLGHDVVLTREPGGTPGAEALRALLVTGDAERWSPWAEACIVNAARADHVRRIIRPALARGDWVICDRYVDSTRAYQGAGKGLADADLCALHAQISGNLWPDLTFVLALPPQQGLARAASRSIGAASAAETRCEKHGSDLHARVAAFFASLSEREPARCHAIAADRSVEAIAADIAALVAA